ncbi:MAG: lipopolysaccharide biosynthesis protein, partial [Alistipes sp.]|nr:lipopolysaccharide biosynthesis protein [Alistipes sp.]
LTVFATLSLVVVDSGFSQMLIRGENPSASDYRTVFGFNILMSLLLYALLTLFAAPIAHFFEMPLIEEIAPVLFLLLPLNALCVIQQAICARNFRFDTLSKAIFLSSLISGAVAVVMALMGCGVWSLVGQRLAAMGVKALLLWWWSNWRPSGEYRLDALKRMAPYSLRLMATDIIATLYNNISQLFVGKFYSAQMLGFYNQGQKLKDMPVAAIQQSVQSVTFPALSKIKDEEQKFSESYRQLMVMVSTFLFPVMVGLIAIAPDMFAVLLGEKWMPTVPYFEILSLSGLFIPLSSIAYNVLKARSDGSLIVRLEIVKRVLMTIILVVVIPQGVVAIAWGVVAMAATEWVVNLLAAARYSSLSILKLINSLMPQLLGSVVMGIAVRWLLSSEQLSLFANFLLEILLGVVIYLLWVFVFRLEAVRIALDMWNNRGKKL